MLKTWWAGFALIACAVIAGCGDDDPVLTTSAGSASPVAVADISDEIVTPSGPFVGSTTFDLAAVGYSQAEYFMSGTATAFHNLDPLTDDGKWNVAASAVTAPYNTRILVYRPIDARRFNGTVIVEWLNVSGGVDAAADWLMSHVQLIREGFAWVGVSAQFVGVEGGEPLLGLSLRPLKTVDPLRYGTLSHPGDSFSYDIYSQVGHAIQRSAVKALSGLEVAALIGVGESQSAFRMVTYINAIQPQARVYDGFLVHSRGGGGVSAARLSESPLPEIEVPGAAKIRDDLNVPVLTFETESDFGPLQFANARQPDSERFRLWEVAGTAHADVYTVVVGPSDTGSSLDAARLVLSTMPVPGLTCSAPINSGPHHLVLNAAMSGLNRWVRSGIAPPSAPRLEGTGSMPFVFARDEHGNVRGGIRTPYVDVPIATYFGEGRGSIVCLLFGRTVPFSAAKLALLYPSHQAYVDAFNASTDDAVRAGFIVPADAALMKAAAAASNIGG